ncbi:NADPH-dependent FMN reductase [Actinoplanes derwentensis]|uniref:FMN reductase n=1 Tax=Actinoplanes derwentensis TaxID=113562 RepID=A0A1H2DFM3_9ACTN|nr:NAD(P)H-dependent oxidoreductase [Actinoplanes derwentensis]GID84811.1 FMN reductase [Actinoplanes derwentensis]SDT81036.1 FMN reductase [Actinoplanes derwentensis]
MRIAIVVGNPKPRSRTLAVAEAVAGVLPGDVVETIDLADHAERLFTWGDPVLDELTAKVAACDLLVVASPTYKATYTGMLKAFLDRYPSNGLAGVVAVPVMTGGAPDHALAVEAYLRPLLVELGASVPTRGLYLVMSRMAELTEITAAWAAENTAALNV